jgi:hypothetical protein
MNEWMMKKKKNGAIVRGDTVVDPWPACCHVGHGSIDVSPITLHPMAQAANVIIPHTKYKEATHCHNGENDSAKSSDRRHA